MREPAPALSPLIAHSGSGRDREIKIQRYAMGALNAKTVDAPAGKQQLHPSNPMHASMKPFSAEPKATRTDSIPISAQWATGAIKTD